MLVRTRAFIDGLEECSAGKGVKIFDFGEAALRRERVIGGNGDVADLDEGRLGRDCGGVALNTEENAALPGVVGEDGAGRACLEFMFQGIAARGGPPRGITGMGVLEDDTLAALGLDGVQQRMFLAFCKRGADATESLRWPGLEHGDQELQAVGDGTVGDVVP